MTKHYAVACDHAGVHLKQTLIAELEALGHTYTDFGTNDPKLDDVGSDYADQVCTAILNGEAERGILVCGTGVGISIRANRYPGIRAAMVFAEFGAEAAMSHNNANIICFGERQVTAKIAARCLKVYDQTEYEGGRHDKRNDAMDRLLISTTQKEQAA